MMEMKNKTYLIITSGDEILLTDTTNNKFDALILCMEYFYDAQRITNIEGFHIIEKSIRANADNLYDTISLCNSFIDGDNVVGIVEIKEDDFLDKDIICCVDPI